jgi:AraC-like DNA-binding protein
MMDILSINNPLDFKGLTGVNNPSTLETHSGAYTKKAGTRHMREVYMSYREKTPHWEWFAVLDGTLQVIGNNEKQSLGICDCFVMPPGTHIAMKPISEKPLVTWLEFTGSLVENIMESVQIDLQDITFGKYHNRFIKSSVAISKLLHERPHNYSFSVHTAFWRFLGFLPGMNQAAPDSIPPDLASVIKFYNETPHTEVSLESMAAIADMGVEKFRKYFSSIMGMPPVQYILKKKITKSKEFLSDSRMTIREISGALGFSDPYYFSRIFKKHEGLSPDQFRKSFYPEFYC